MTFLIGILAIIIGAAFCFAGFRFFLLLLPLWGFFIGFNVGTDVITAIFGDGSFATLISWGAGFLFAIVFAVLSYLWYWLAIVILAGGVGYSIGTAVWGAIFGTTFGFVGFLLGLVVAVIVAGVALFLNVPKYLVVILTAAGGAVTVIGGWFLLIGKIPSDQVHWSVVGGAHQGLLVLHPRVRRHRRGRHPRPDRGPGARSRRLRIRPVRIPVQLIAYAAPAVV